MDQEELHYIAEEVLIRLRYRLYGYDEEGNDVLCNLTGQAREEALLQAVARQEALGDKDYLDFPGNRELHRITFSEALEMPLEIIREKHLKDTLAKARNIMRKGTVEYGVTVSDEVPDSYLNDLLALRWRENLKLWAISGKKERQGGEIGMIVLTGDTHREFDRIFEFCEEYGTTRDDVLVILGDMGINYYLDESDEALKRELSQLEVTLLCVHGNHEERPSELLSYEEVEWHGGLVYVEPEFPNLLFAKDGEIYDLEGRTVMAIGGAYSVDKHYRLANRLPWFESEQPSDEIKDYMEAQLDRVGWRVDYVLSHTAPLQYEPRHAFLPSIDQSQIDKSTEKWPDAIQRRVSCDGWFCGHYHIDDQMGQVRIMYNDFLELGI